MPKKVTDAEGNTFVEVTPWYKKWWIWVLAVVAVVIIGAALGSSGSSSDSSSDSASKRADTTSKTASKPAAKAKSTTYKVGQTADLEGMHLKVNSVKPASSFDDGDTTPKSGNQYYTVNITLNNTTSEKQDYNSYDFSIVASGNSTDMDEINTDDDNTIDSGSLTKGGHVTGDLIGQSKKDGKVQLVYKPNSFENQKVTFDIQD